VLQAALPADDYCPGAKAPLNPRASLGTLCIRKVRIVMKISHLLLGALLLCGVCAQARADTTLEVVLEAEVTTVDPYFTTAYITRTFGYMVYDTLFAMDSKGQIKPQMVDSYTVSDDRMSYRFTLRDGLKWHDGTPVTAADCVASLKRWGPRDGLGRLLTAATESLTVENAKTFTLKLKQPFGLVIDALGKPSSATPFMLPERLANVPGATKLTEVMGSGPFIFRADLWRPGDSMTLDRNPNYLPRAEPADFLSGGKVAKVDHIHLRVIPDGSTAASALQSGEVDYLQYIPFDLIGPLQKDKRVKVLGFDGIQMFMGYYSLNLSVKPFNDPAVRQVLWKAVDQSTVLQGLGVPEDFSRTCHSYFICGSALETAAGAEVAANPSAESARAALAKTAYDGTPVVVMQASDIEALKVSSQILADMLRNAGFKVDLQAVDWGTLLARRLKKEGWNAFGVTAAGFDLSSPLTAFYFINNCLDFPGWVCDPRITDGAKRFAAAATLDQRKAIASEIQIAGYEATPAVLWGQFAQPAGYRATLRNLIPSSIPVFWNVEK
jgi:peptide/nickel transport system substrate-binding protein